MNARRGAIALAFFLAGCSSVPHASLLTAKALPGQLLGRVAFNATYQVQATAHEIISGATVSLIDPATGNTLSSAVTDANGNFILSFPGVSPTPGSFYTLEAVKGLSVGSSPNRAGAAAVRLRSLLEWTGGWVSLTGSQVVVSPASTALSDIVSLKQNNGVGIPLAPLMSTLSGNTFTEAGTGLTNAGDFQPVLFLVQQAVQLDEDPLAAVGLNPANGTYQLTIGSPLIGSLTPAVPTPGGTLSVTGAYFDNTASTSFWFGSTQAASWSVSIDRETATISVATSAYSAPLTLQRPDGAVQTLSPYLMLHGTVGTFAGNGAASYSDATGPSAEFNSPHGIARDAMGNLFVCDLNNQRIRKITPTGVVTTFAGSGVFGFADGQGTAAQFNAPQGLAFDATGTLYVADEANNRIRKITPTGLVTTLAGNGIAGHVDGTASAEFNLPRGLALDTTGNVYVADSQADCIRKITPLGVVSTIAGQPNVQGFTDGIATAAQFNQPYSLTSDGLGNLYVADTYNHSIRCVASNGQVTTIAGNGSPAFADGIATAARFHFPNDVILDHAGNLVVSDMWNQRIRLVKLSTLMTTTLAGNGTIGYVDGPLNNAEFNYTQFLAIDPQGNLFVTDRDNHRIRTITP
jgi:sugar lactone lactonase YvrE